MAMITTHTQFRPAFTFAGVLRAVSGSIAVHRQRQQLKTLDDSRLDDLGISFRQARREARRPVWDVPGHWTRATF